MATRISFSTHYPDRMKELAGKPTRFPEKLITMIDPYSKKENLNDLIFQLTKAGVYDFNFKVNYHPKTTTIRKNYDYWKSKEGQLIQPFFWAGKPYRSKHVVFCPEVRLKMVRNINLNPNGFVPISIAETPEGYGYYVIEGMIEIGQFTQNEGFDHPDHFWMWFDQDMEGAYLELESVGG